MCRALIEKNPYVDEIWEIPVHSHDEVIAAWEGFRRELQSRKRLGDFDHIFLTQIYPDNFSNYDGTVRASIFRGYPHRIKVPVTPIIRLSEDDVTTVANFARAHDLGQYRHVILFEFVARSGQSFVTPEFALAVAQAVVSARADTAVVLSSNTGIVSQGERIVDASILPFHLNAELSNYCTLLVGCSSGISWLCTSDWAKRLPMIQLLRRETSVYASFVHDHEHFGLGTESIIEVTDCVPDRIVDCILTCLQDGFPAARARFHERIPVRFRFYAQVLSSAWDRNGGRVVARSVMHAVRRYGPHPNLIGAVSGLVARRAEINIRRRLSSLWK